MGLEAWRLELSEDPPTDDVWAQVDAMAQYKSAKVEVDDGVFEWAPSKQRALFAHELSHLYTAHMQDSTRALKKVLKKKTWQLWDDAFDHAEESCVEELGRFFERLLPLPSL